MTTLAIGLDDDLAGHIAAMVKDNIDMTEDELADAVDKAADEATKLLEERSRKRTYPKKGSYAKGWRKKVSRKDGEGAEAIVYNANKPGLTHLLEHDHPTNHGGRVTGDHVIQGVYEDIAKNFGKGNDAS